MSMRKLRKRTGLDKCEIIHDRVEREFQQN